MIQLILVLVEIIILFFLSQALTRIFSKVIYSISRSKTVVAHVLSFVFLPGVILHELSHLLVAGLLFVRVGQIEFVPKFMEAGVKMGSVAIGKTDPIRRAIIGLAPFFVGLLILGIIAYFAAQNLSTGLYILLFYIVFTVANTMFSSPKDLEGFIEVALVMGFFAMVYYVFTVITATPIATISLPFESIREILMPLIFSLAVAIVIDSILIIILKWFSK